MIYQPFRISIIGILLFGQLWVIVASHGDWMTDLEIDPIELCDRGDSEPEEENNNEQDDKLKIGLTILKFDISIDPLKIAHSKDSLSIHHPASITPPPESFIS